MSHEIAVIKEVDLPEVHIALKSDGIAYVLLKDQMTLDVELQMRMLNAYNTVTSKVLTPFIFEAGEGIIVTKEARDNAILIEEISPCKAMAVIVDNIAYAMIGNFYLKFNKPKRPYKVFKNREDGLKWLQQYK